MSALMCSAFYNNDHGLGWGGLIINNKMWFHHSSGRWKSTTKVPTWSEGRLLCLLMGWDGAGSNVGSLLRSHSCGEENGNPLQYICLENPMDRGDWWATVHRVTKHLDMSEPLSNNSTPEGSTLLLQSPPKAPLPNTSKWALEFHHVSFGGHKHSDHSNILPKSNISYSTFLPLRAGIKLSGFKEAARCQLKFKFNRPVIWDTK